MGLIIKMSKFHFTRRNVDEKIVQDIQKLSALSAEQLASLVKIALTFLARHSTASTMMQSIEEFGNEEEINTAALKSILRAILVFFRGATAMNLSPNLLADDLSALGLSKEHIVIIAKLWKSASGALASAAIAETLQGETLVDMEWRFGVTAANSEFENVGEVFVQLKLKLDKGGSNGKRTVPFEMTLPQFYTFLKEL